MQGVGSLGYVGWNVTNLPAWDDELQTVFGLELRADGDEDTHRYRLDERHHRIALHRADTDALAYLGWEVASHEVLEAIAGRLADAGVTVRRGTDEECERRAVLALIAFEDPDGIATEVYAGPVVDRAPFKPARPLTGFRTGDMGLGHVVLFCKDRAASCDFYRDLLGFRLSDEIHWPDDRGGTAKGAFLHCNPRHHSVALLNECFGARGGAFNHLMIEALSPDDVGQAYDIVLERGYPLGLTLGRHTNDCMTSFYLHTPSGWTIEYGWGGELVDDATWATKLYDAPSRWGHKPQDPPPEVWPFAGGA